MITAQLRGGLAFESNSGYHDAAYWDYFSIQVTEFEEYHEDGRRTRQESKLKSLPPIGRCMGDPPWPRK